jgi:benzoyl-CoA reductase/2-hydroxyglutaryl-CoA dehydratase subunit BcrC/BadD/HgdB
MSLTTLNDILEVLKQRRAHCRELLDLSRRQNRVIDASDYTSLLSILGQKQRVLVRLDELKHRHPELGERWESVREAGPATVRRECSEIISEIEAILAELMQTEKAGADELSQRRETTRRQLESIAQGVHINEIYRDNVAPFSHRFLDLNR